MIRQSIITLVIGSVSLLGFYSPAKCIGACDKAVNMIESSLTKIHDGLYLSKEGKLYEKIPCEIYLAKDIINKYLDLKKELKSLHITYHVYLNQLLTVLTRKFNRWLGAATIPNRSLSSATRTHEVEILRTERHNNDINDNELKKLQILIFDLEFHGVFYDLNDPNLLQILANIKKIYPEIYPEETEILKNIENNERLLINTQREIININKKIYDIENQTPGISKQVYPSSSNISTRRGEDFNSNNPHGTANETEISPVYYKKFIEINRELTFEEALALKNHLLVLISDKLYKKYGDNYKLLENNNSVLWAKVTNLTREVTDSNWEKLELTITPIIVSTTQIDVSISAILFTKSGFTIIPPNKEDIDRYSDNYKALEEYISELITYFKKEIPISDFKLDE